MDFPAEPDWAQILTAAPTVSYNIGRLDRLINQQLSEALAAEGVSLPQFTMLSNLHHRGGATNAALAARSFISPQAANQIINVMHQNGWVSKRADPNNGRMVLIELTDSGRQYYQRCAEAAARFERKLLDGLPPEAVLMFKSTLKHMLNNLRT